ncbi:MAG: DUF1579 family protein [Promethearchaeota archaeon]
MTKDFDKKKFFKQIVGNWEGTAITYFKPDELGDKSQIKGTIIEVLDGLFLLHEYEGTLMKNKMLGLAIYGYNKNKKQFEIAWVDNQHMGPEIMFSKARNTDNKFSVLGHYTGADENDVWGWRTILEHIDPDNLVIQHFNITPDGQEYLGVDIDYKRVK